MHSGTNGTNGPDPDEPHVLILRPLPSDIPADRRFKAALKMLLRTFGLRNEHFGPARLYKPKPPSQ